MKQDSIEPRPARPRRPKVTVDELGDTLRLRYRQREWGAGCFLIFWLVGWTVACVFLAGLVIREPAAFHFLFAIPFWASWFFVAAKLLGMFLQREELSLGPTGAVFLRRVLIRTKSQETPLEEIRQFDLFERVVDSESGCTVSGIEMKTVGLPLEFAAGLGRPELLWLQDVLEQQLSALRERLHLEPPAEALPGEAEERFAVKPAEPPSDCSWRREDDFGDLTFRQSGRLSWSSVGGLVFANLFCNGIISVFVYGLWGGMDPLPQGVEWWGLFFFLIPFEAIGLLLLAGLLLVLLEPTRRTSWRIGNSQITCRLAWLGVGRTWDYPLESLDRIEVEDQAENQPKRGKQLTLPWKSAGATYRLSFIDASNGEVCSIDGLTEGEARWMAGVIRGERPAWFR